MGISLGSWRAAVGTFLIRSRILEEIVIPKFHFYSNWSGFSKRKEWGRYLLRCKNHNKARATMNLYLGFVIISWTFQCIILNSGDIHPNPGPNFMQDYNNISICHSNIRSLKQNCDSTGTRFKLDHVKCQLAGNFDIITLSETWLTGSDSSDDYIIPGY